MSARVPISLDPKLADEIVRLAVEAQQQLEGDMDIRLVAGSIKARLVEKLSAAGELSPDYATKFACAIPPIFLGSILRLYSGKSEPWYELYKENVSSLRQALRTYLKALAEGYGSRDFDRIMMETARFFGETDVLARQTTKE
jgi:hypothetical protein